MLPRPPLLLLLLLSCSCQATHFFGTVATYTPKETDGNGNVTVVLRYKLNFHECTDLRWDCLVGECGKVTEALVQDVQNKADGEWCQRERISTRLVPSNAPFELWTDSGNWIDNIVNGIVAWRAIILVELRNRSDTNRPNASPQTTILPLLRVPSNCRRDFDLLAFDPDGDEVQCRYGNVAAMECNPCTPPSVLSLAASCTLSFSATNRSSEGPYAVQLVMEDFPRHTITLTQSDGAQTTVTPSHAISKIPIQFVVRVDPAVPSCTDGLYLPRFLPPTPDQGARLYANVNENLLITVSSEATNSSVSELLFSGPHNAVLSPSGSGVFTLSWTPAAEEDGESRPICFVVEALHNVTKFHSELRCVIVVVGEAPASTTTTTIPPTTTKTSASPTLPPTTTATTASSPTTTVPSTTTAVPPPPTTTTTSTSLPPPTTTSSLATSSLPPTTKTSASPTLPPTTTATTASSPTTTVSSTTTAVPPPPTTTTGTSLPPPTTTSSLATSSLPPTTKTSASPTLPPTTTATTASSPTTTVPSTTTTAVPPPPTTTTGTSLPPPTTTAPPLTSTIPTTTTGSLATSSVPPTTTNTSATTTATVPPTSTATTSPSPPPPTTTGPPLTSTTPTTTTTSSSATTMVPSTTTTFKPTTAPSSSPTASTQRFPSYVVGLRLRISTTLQLNEEELLDVVQQVSHLLLGDGLQLTVTKYRVVPL